MRALRKIVRYEPRTSTIQALFRWLLGVFLIYAGMSHLTFSRQEFLSQVPRWVPLDGDFVVVASGIVEIILGAALVVLSKFRAPLGWITAAFFIAVFPGNISQFTNRIDAFGMDSDTARGMRLLFQPLLVLWALWSTGAWQAWKHRNRELANNSD